MIYLILFMHDIEPAVRVIHGTREHADDACEKVKFIYDTEARVVEIHETHDDREQIDADYAESIE